jgi:hypothetical protein
MIADLRRLVEVLDCDVSTEEKSSHICDRSDARYPILARQLAARRDNLKVTIAALEAPLGSAQPRSQNCHLLPEPALRSRIGSLDTARRSDAGTHAA